MNRFLQIKRNQVFVLILGTLAVLGLMWFFVVQNRQAALKTGLEKVAQMELKVQAVKQGLDKEDKFKRDLEFASQKILKVEEFVSEGDLYRWLIKTMSQFQIRFNIDIDEFSRPRVSELNFVHKLPYGAGHFSVTGTAYYHDFGLFLADFENQFPYSWLSKLELEVAPATEQTEEDKAKLTFRMDFVTLVKTSGAMP